MPRAGLTPSIVVAEAARLADDVGFDALTLAALAARFGVAVPSLYKHVDGLEAVRRGVSILALRELGTAMAEELRSSNDHGGPNGTDGASSPDITSRPGSAKGQGGAGGQPGEAPLRALARAYRAYARAHPGRYAATLRAAPAGDVEYAAAGDAIIGTAYGVLGARGLVGDDAIDATRAVRAALHGFVTLEAAGGFGLPRDVDRSFERLVEALDLGLAALGTDAQGPAAG